MKLNSVILLVFTVAVALLHTSCASKLTPAQQAEISLIETNAGKDITAAGLGLIVGGKAGALAGLASQEAANLRARQMNAKTAAKNPPAVPVAP